MSVRGVISAGCALYALYHLVHSISDHFVPSISLKSEVRGGWGRSPARMGGGCHGQGVSDDSEAGVAWRGVRRGEVDSVVGSSSVAEKDAPTPTHTRAHVDSGVGGVI